MDDVSQFFYEYVERRDIAEDCLYLNVWTAGLNDNGKRPVMFWIHGGGFAFGSSFEFPAYDGRNLAERGNVVVVSINHRLNVFGFLHLGEYGEDYADSVNVGMLDIVAALRWVRENVAVFGGDPNNITVFGQSGGGAKVNFLMAMPSATGLFHKAITQSSTPFISNPRAIDFSVRHAAETVRQLKITASPVAELRKVPAETLHRVSMDAYFQVELETDASARWPQLTTTELSRVASDKGLSALLSERYGWDQQRIELEMARFNARRYTDNLGPVADGRVVAEVPFNPSAPKLSAHIPMLIGHALNEGFGPNSAPEREQWSEADIRAILAKQPTPVPASVLDALRRAYPDVRPVEILTHAIWGGLEYRIDAVTQATRKAALRAAPAYLFTFAWKTDVLNGRPRAFHGSEIPFVFRNTDLAAHRTGGTEGARAMSDKISNTWVAFARSGHPSHPDIPNWPAFDPATVPTMVFDDTCRVSFDHDREARKIFVDSATSQK
jgi:para-nitrobenzyl esterase